MKSHVLNYIRVAAVMLTAAVALAACDTPAKTIKTEVVEYADSSDHYQLKVKAELPTPDGKAAKLIRSELQSVIDSIELWLPAQVDMEMIEYELNIEKIEDSLGYVVFQNLDYFYGGGAHGGIIGQGFLTFDKSSGRRVGPMLKDNCAEAMQPLLKEGLISYYAAYGETISEAELMEHLIIWDSDIIPLPTWDPYPSSEGMVFTYQQYEIASYADGMPNFVIPFEKIAPYLSAEASALLE